MRAGPGSKLGLVFTLILSILFTLGLSPTVNAASLQPAAFFFHKQSSRTINTISSTLWSNTTQLWSPGILTENRTASSITPATWDFYTEPALAGNVDLTGFLNSTLYMSASTTTGGGTIVNATISKVSSTGASTPLAFAFVSTNIGSRPKNIYLTGTSNTYQLEAGSILNFTVTATVTGPLPVIISLYYDSSSYPSHVLVTFQSRIGTTTFQTYDQGGDRITSFSRNVTTRQITLLATLFDALGIYDIAVVKANISSPGTQVLTDDNLTPVQGGASDYLGTWELNYTYSNNDPSGVYTSSLWLSDNTGVSATNTLSYVLFAEWVLGIRTVTQDSSPLPIPGVTVFVLTNAGTLVYFGTSNASGWLTPTNLLLPDNTSYTIKSYWEGQWLSQIGPYDPTHSSSISLGLSAYQVSFSKFFRDWSGASLPHPPSGFQLLCPNGSVTRPNFSASYLLPAGTYQISQVLWDGKDVTASAVSFNPKDGVPTLNLQLYDLSIFVVDENRRPVPTATVTLFQASQVIQEGTTGEKGNLTVHYLTRGDYTAVVQTTQILRPVAAKVNLVETSTATIKVSSSASPTAGLNQSYLLLLLAAGIVAALATSLKLSRRKLRRVLDKKKG